MPEIKNSRILLIEPPFYRLFKNTYSLTRYPPSLGYLAVSINKHTNWKVKVYNADFHPAGEQIKESYMVGKGSMSFEKNILDKDAPIWKEIASVVKEYEPDIVGLTVTAPKFSSAIMIAELVKRILPDSLIVAGGSHATSSGTELLKTSCFNMIILGEGEKTICDLLDALAENKPLNSIKGLLYKTNGQIKKTVSREFISNLDELPYPHEHAPEILWNYDKYPLTALKYIITTRGCPYDCFFCASKNIWKRKVRYRSNDDVISEIKSLYQLGLRSVHFDDDTFGIDRHRLFDLCDQLSKNFSDLAWSCEMHVKLIDETVVRKMKESGCFSISIGVESGNDEILQKMRKNITTSEAIKACKIIKNYGLELSAFFIFGLPWETKDTLADTFQIFDEIDCDQSIVGTFAPYPGADSYQYCQENGLLQKNYDISVISHQSLRYHYCHAFSEEDFKRKVLKFMKKSDRHNTFHRIRQIFSSNSIWRIKELGLTKSMKKGFKVLVGK